MKILVIDDTLSLLDKVKDILTMEGHEVVTATDGLEGLEKVGATTPDLIFIDLIMPALNGYDFLGKVKQMPKYNRIPVIVLSAQASKEDREKAFAVKADGFLTKPCSTEDLLRTLSEVYERSRSN